MSSFSPYDQLSEFETYRKPKITATAKTSIPMMMATNITIAMGIDFSKNFGYALFGGVLGEFSTI
jgi:hypothetical protein